MKFILTIAGFYALLKASGLLAGAQLPSSVVAMYMIFAVLTSLMVLTSSQDGARELAASFIGLFSDTRSLKTRVTVIVIMPVMAYYLISAAVTRDVSGIGQASGVMHPGPPLTISAYGKEFDLASVENPFRALERTDRARFEAFVKDGETIYFKRCVHCHGAKLDGAGQFAAFLNPGPVSFRGSDTIAQLQESYVFWRVVKGGRGLGARGAKSTSAMPAWEEELSEDDVWKTIMFLYDFTGNRPRAWKK